ncbi:MBL fold metallo-hydrolase [Kiritimatiellota bacterium B12222]|nr:MBL fold metallo-hydrolase [Kiritimatiellota bacterium B12222]
MDIKIIPTGMIQTNCVILSNDQKQALIIDPGADADEIQAFILKKGLTVIGYPFTHGHYDHICAIGDIHAACPAPCWMHPLDLAWAFTSRNQNLPWYRQPDPATVPDIQKAWEKDGPFSIGPFEFETLFLPGHSPGSVAFYFPKEHLLIGGDVLFKGSVGRTDLPGGDTATLFRSLRRLAKLPPQTRVLSGHGPETTIGDELRSNPYMRQALGA